MADDTDAPDTDAPATSDTLRSDVERAFEQVETRDAPPAGDAAIPAQPQAAPTEAPAQVPPGERARGPDGKFIPSAAAPAKAPEKAAAPPAQPLAAPPKPNGAAQPAPAQAAPAAPGLKPPVSWKPGAREHWGKLPPDVQQEVVRRETEVARSLQESARAREALTHVQSTLAPFAQNIHASGLDAISMVGNLMKADNTLRHGSIAEKALLVADICNSYGVNIEALDQALAGKQPSADPNAQLADRMRREMQQQLQPVLGYFNRMQGARENALAQINSSAVTDVESFGAEHEFFEDVRADMADIMDLFTQRGQTITLQDAYDRAIKLNPQVSEIVSKRAETERASAAAQAAQRARRAAVSITSAPAPAGAAPGPAGDDRRAQIESAWDSASGS